MSVIPESARSNNSTYKSIPFAVAEDSDHSDCADPGVANPTDPSSYTEDPTSYTEDPNEDPASCAEDTFDANLHEFLDGDSQHWDHLMGRAHRTHHGHHGMSEASSEEDCPGFHVTPGAFRASDNGPPFSRAALNDAPPPGGVPGASGSEHQRHKLLMMRSEDEDELKDLLTIQRLDSNEVLIERHRKPPKLIGKYLFGDRIGEGSYAKVKECLDTENLCRLAVKILKLNTIRRKIPLGEQNVRREIRLLRRLNHDNVIRLVDVLERGDKEKLYLFMEFCVGSLQETLDSVQPHRAFPFWQAHLYFVQLVDGLDYLHSCRVVHKDIKPGNILLTTADRIKISDLGVAEELSFYEHSDRCSTGQGTPQFQAPEIASGKFSKCQGFACDWWSAGVTLYNLISGEYPFGSPEGNSILKLYDAIVNNPLKMPTKVEVDSILESFFRGILDKDPDQRYNSKNIRAHDWMRKKQHFSHLDRVLPPSYEGDPSRSLTVYPYLAMLYQSTAGSPAADGSPLLGGRHHAALHPEKSIEVGRKFSALRFPAPKFDITSSSDYGSGPLSFMATGGTKAGHAGLREGSTSPQRMDAVLKGVSASSGHVPEPQGRDAGRGLQTGSGEINGNDNTKAACSLDTGLEGKKKKKKGSKCAIS